MVFLEAFANCTSAFSGALRQAGVANFVTDVQHVTIVLFRTGDGSFWRL